MSKTTLVRQQVPLQELFQMMQESKEHPQQIPECERILGPIFASHKRCPHLLY